MTMCAAYLLLYNTSVGNAMCSVVKLKPKLMLVFLYVPELPVLLLFMRVIL